MIANRACRGAPHARRGEEAAGALAPVLAGSLSLPPDCVAAINKELVEPPRKNVQKVRP